MFIIVFESMTPPEHERVSSNYYEKLQKLVLHQQGFISETPFESVNSPNRGLTLAEFADETAAHEWRMNPTHLRIQKSAREKIFTDFRIRAGPEFPLSGVKEPATPAVASSSRCRTLLVLRYTKEEGMESLDLDSLRPHTSTEYDPNINAYKNDQNVIQILSWETEEAATKFRSCMTLPSHVSVHCIDIVRDYGKSDRKEAPPVEG